MDVGNVKMSSVVKVLTLFLLATCQITRSTALSCPCWWDKPTPEDPRSYREKYCDLALSCPPEASIIPDACGCCDVCSKVEGDVCGGPWYVMGHCSEGYECIDVNTKDPVKRILGNIPAGTCQKKPSLIETEPSVTPRVEPYAPAVDIDEEPEAEDDPEAETMVMTLVQDATTVEVEVTDALTTEQPRRRKNRKDRKRNGKKNRDGKTKLGKKGRRDRKNELHNLIPSL